VRGGDPGFNAEAAKLGAGVRILTISMDLPFAQKRWCEPWASTRWRPSPTTASQLRPELRGAHQELRLLARAVFVWTRRHGHLHRAVKEVGDDRFMPAALTALAQAAS
jgi:thiol peroxidase